jgi:hypothetical protein
MSKNDIYSDKNIIRVGTQVFSQHDHELIYRGITKSGQELISIMALGFD